MSSVSGSQETSSIAKVEGTLPKYDLTVEVPESNPSCLEEIFDKLMLL